MKKRRWPGRLLVGLGLAAVTLSGCQTWTSASGMTLPSPRYLNYPPQYFPQSPPFPLQRELASQEATTAAAIAGAEPGAAVPLPAAVPPVPAGERVAPLPPPP